ncbi:hypothetical protein IEE_04522 [Bacillus cereus BAG5X1-1]|uniref:ABM domain-containing protein n=1 Tax=Bacillus cereus BAG5X1-1 TaxID=1053189 RepID=J7XAG7_BACCE|nr:hypothetical protein [Bacillus cereus]EJQ41278.1 hypothetical protein IEE_04522 [Bacillus cereus BAG5X1-1]
MFIVTKLIHIKYGYENEIFHSLRQHYPSSGTQGFINMEFSHMHRTDDGAEYMVRMLWKTQQYYHEWISKRKSGETWKHQIQNYILSAKSNAAYIQ